MLSYANAPYAGNFCRNWNTLGSPVAHRDQREIGFDWVLLTRSMPPGDSMTLLDQLMAFKGQQDCPIVRIAWNDRVLFKRALDLGASGIMVPTVESAAQARQALARLRYPPRGSRGVSGACRAAGYTMHFKEYAARSAEELTTIVQIENQKGLDNLEDMAAVDGVDVIFVGPVDLSFSIGKRDQFKDHLRVHPRACRQGRREAWQVRGILVPDLSNVPNAQGVRFQLRGRGLGAGAIVATLKKNLAGLRSL
jgi:2-keto-3-deoxy-L-rhamnonate aldolase RhmA